MSDADIVDIVGNIGARLFLEQGGKIGLCHMTHICKKAQRQRFRVVEINVGNASLGNLRIVFHGMISYQQTVFVDHIPFDLFQVASSMRVVDQHGDSGGQVVDIDRVYVSPFHGLPAQGIEDDQKVLGVQHDIRVAGCNFVIFELGIQAGWQRCNFPWRSCRETDFPLHSAPRCW